MSIRINKLNDRLYSGLRDEKPHRRKKYSFILFKFIDKCLRMNGYPLGLSVSRYLIIKFFLTVIFAVPPLIANARLHFIFIFAAIGFFAIDILLVIDAADNRKRIESDMPNLINNLYMQLEAGIPFKDCLEILHQSVIYSKVLKDALKELQIRFIMKEHNIVLVCDEIEKDFNNVSFSILLMAFRQYTDSGKMKNILHRQNELHMKKEEELIYRESKQILSLAVISTVLIAINCVLMLVWPMFSLMNDKMNELLK
jgi:hypothetical protein